MGNTESRFDNLGDTWRASKFQELSSPECEKVRALLEDSSLTVNSLVDLASPEYAGRLVACAASDDLHTCFAQLVAHRIHAAPVYDDQASTTIVSAGDDMDMRERHWIGLLDWRDFVHYVIQLFGEERKIETALDEQCARSLAKDHRMHPVFADTSLFSLISGFGQYGVKRRPVFSRTTPSSSTSGERLLGMVSQLDIIRWLSRQRKELDPVFNSISIQNVVQGEQGDPRFNKMRQVCSVMEDTLMWDVLGLLDQSHLNGVSVVDHAGKLLANISVSDLQYTVERNLNNLFSTVEDFLERVPRRPLVTCSPSATLMEVVDKLAEAGVYRIYVINEEEEPIAVITMTDVLNALLLIFFPPASSTPTLSSSV